MAFLTFSVTIAGWWLGLSLAKDVFIAGRLFIATLFSTLFVWGLYWVGRRVLFGIIK